MLSKSRLGPFEFEGKKRNSITEHLESGVQITEMATCDPRLLGGWEMWRKETLTATGRGSVW